MPAEIRIVYGNSKGGPGYVYWIYLQKSDLGTLIEKDFWFGDDSHVYSCAVDINKTRFVSTDKPKDTLDILNYTARRGY